MTMEEPPEPAVDFEPGYPIDQRAATYGQKRAADPIGDFEYRAARIVARLTGERVVLQDDNSRPGMADIRIDYTDREPAFVEVVVDVNPRYASLYDAIARDEWTISAPSLSRRWWATFNPNADLRQLKRQLPKQLAVLEADNVPLGAFLHPWEQHEISDDRLPRGVSGLISAEPNHGESGSILLRPMGAHGPTHLDWHGFNTWISDYLTSDLRSDVRNKLSSTGAAERHAFIGTTLTTPWPAINPLHDRYMDLPPERPDLPREITHLWVATADGPGRCLCWFPHRGWLDPRTHWATQ